MKSKQAVKGKKALPRLKPSDNSFPIVAIGASAGGLEAITELLTHLPANTGMAFIYVQHLSPDHKSLLTPILARATKMKVQEIDHMDKIKPDNVFVIPHNKGIEVTDGHIKLVVRKERGAAAIDVLFGTLAKAQKERVIGVVLSGSASDGTQGLMDIKYAGGLTFAQDSSAKFSSMPESAISAGAVDFILSPKQIALELTRLSKHPLVKSNRGTPHKEGLISNDDPELKEILNLLHKTVGVDFSHYKMSTLKRRIVRRMLLYKMKTPKEYSKLLIQKTEEIDILYQDLLINVTNFFRDTDAHTYLKTTLFPKLLKSKTSKQSLRIWVPACSTGEEAFSIAMMLMEIQESKAVKIPVYIFATDLSQNAIAKARVGMYTKEALKAVSPKRIQRFFTKAEGGFRVAKAIRDMCVFAPHNILADPPFSRLDFISCCNLFIYLDTTAQQRAVSTFHYALNPGGHLMVGKSESIGAAANLFTSINKKFKIFGKKKSPSATLPELTRNISRQAVPHENTVEPKSNSSTQFKKKPPVGTRSLDSAIDSALIANHMPASVVIDYNMEIQQFRGATDLYLTHAPGKASFNILKMARPEIAFDLRSAIAKAINTKQTTRKSGIEIKVHNAVRYVHIEVAPLQIEWDEALLLVLFTEQEQFDHLTVLHKNGKSNSLVKDRRIKKLEEELVTAHADSLTMSREHEAFIEELQSANEEVVSSNEELQTVNEELETSKEELESLNEELITTNQELQTRNDLLNESYDYSEAITATIHDPLLTLDKSLRVKSANKAFYKAFNIGPEETEGTFIYNLGSQEWNIARLRVLLEDIIPKKTSFRDFEVTHTFPAIGKKVMLLNASRIVRQKHGEELLLLSIHDVSEMREKTLELQRKETELLAQEITLRKTEEARLEKTVGERTAELRVAYEELEKKGIGLQQMNRELEAFTFISSHDLQEPLRKIQTLSSLLLKKESERLSSEGKDYFLRMHSSAQRMQLLIQNLLSFSRLNPAARKFEKTDLNKVVEEAQQQLAETIEQKKATIDVGKMCELKTISFQFQQLFENLISNSLKFARPGIPLQITITSRHISPQGKRNSQLAPGKEYCHIRVKDNGIGFDNKYNEKIFEVFQRLHDKEHYAGTGIGLAIVKKIVENHHGIISAKGEPDKGVQFDIYIPTNRSKNDKAS